MEGARVSHWLQVFVWLMSDIGQESTLLGYSAFALGMALSAP
jgi:hypothetical protein